MAYEYYFYMEGSLARIESPTGSVTAIINKFNTQITCWITGLTHACTCELEEELLAVATASQM